jgi:hypothetical protein
MVAPRGVTLEDTTLVDATRAARGSRDATPKDSRDVTPRDSRDVTAKGSRDVTAKGSRDVTPRDSRDATPTGSHVTIPMANRDRTPDAVASIRAGPTPVVLSREGVASRAWAANGSILDAVIRKPSRLFVLVLLLWQAVASLGVTVTHAATPLVHHGQAVSTGSLPAADCPDHAAAGTASHRAASHDTGSNHASKHDCCGSASACQCVAAAMTFVQPLLAVISFSTPVRLPAYTGVPAAPVLPFFRPPIA